MFTMILLKIDRTFLFVCLEVGDYYSRTQAHTHTPTHTGTAHAHTTSAKDTF